MRKSILIFSILFLILPLVSAATVDNSDYTFAQGERFDLKRTCILNGTYCSLSATCNVTIQAPNGQNVFNNSAMTVNSGWANITFPLLPKNSRYFGFYLNTMTCTDGGTSGAESWFIEQTADGNPSQTFPTQLIILLLCYVLLVIGIGFKDYYILKVIPATGLVIMGVITLYPGYSYINWSTLSGLMLGAISLGIGFYFLFDPYFSHGTQKEHYIEEIEEVDDATD